MQNEYIQACAKLGLPIEKTEFPSFFISQEKLNQIYSNRRKLCSKYAWAIPNENAILECVKHSPLVEMGAGTGYWARLIKESGGDIIAYDEQPIRLLNHYHKMEAFEPTFFNVKRGLPSKLRKHKDRTLLLCWPPYNEYMAFESMIHYGGNTLIFVGENCGGCTGDNLFFKHLRRNWRLVKSVYIPVWDGVHDMMFVYKRVFRTNRRLEKKRLVRSERNRIKRRKQKLGSHDRWIMKIKYSWW